MEGYRNSHAHRKIWTFVRFFQFSSSLMSWPGSRLELVSLKPVKSLERKLGNLTRARARPTTATCWIFQVPVCSSSVFQQNRIQLVSKHMEDARRPSMTGRWKMIESLRLLWFTWFGLGLGWGFFVLYQSSDWVTRSGSYCGKQWIWVNPMNWVFGIE